MVNGSWYRRGYLPTDVGYPKIPNKIPRSRLFETMPSGSNWDVHIERSKNRCSNTGCSKIGQPFDVYKYVYIYTNICIYTYIYITIYIYIFFVHVIPFQTAILPHRLELRRTFVASPGPLPPKTAPQWPSTPSPDTPRGGERSVAGGRGFFIKGGFFPKKHVGQFLGDGFLKNK